MINNLKSLRLSLPIFSILIFFSFFPNILRIASNTAETAGLMKPVESTGLSGETVRLVFAGDIMTHSQQFQAALSGGKYRFSPQFEDVRGLLSSADIVAGNLETTLSGSGIPYSGYPRFNTPDSLLDALREAGFNLLFIANNHAMDYGADGFRRTAETARAGGFLLTGVDWESGGGEILSADVRGVRIAFLNYTYGYNAAPGQDKPGPEPSPLTRARVLADIAAAKNASADAVVVYPHWGVEDSPHVTDEQRELTLAYWDAGADIVVGAHPHVLQEIEILRSGDKTHLAAWSLGNFISSQRFPAQQASALLAVELEKNETGTAIRKISVAPVRTESVRLPGLRKRTIPVAFEVSDSIWEALKIKSADLPKETDEFGYYTIFEKAPIKHPFNR